MDWIIMLGFNALMKIATFKVFGTRFTFPVWEFALITGGLSFMSAVIFAGMLPRTFMSSLSGNLLWSIAAGPALEEIVFRFAAITVLFGITNSIILAVFLAAILFSLAHLGHGALRALDTLIGGLLFGILFAHFGLIPAIIAHMAHNSLSAIVGG